MKKNCCFRKRQRQLLVTVQLVVILFITGCNCLQSPRILKRHEIPFLDNYSVEWEIDLDKEEIEFLVIARTKGYIGFGISYTGSMANSDIIVGGVYSNGSIYFKDYHAKGLREPSIDKIQDWHLLEGTENGTHTILRFNRKLNTCDEEDVAITDGTLKIIWSLGGSDSLSYHGHRLENRGALAVNFKDPASKTPDLSQYKTWRIAQPLQIPTNDTTYWCTFYKGPQLSNKHHVVGFGIFTDGDSSKTHTHHADVYKCKPPPGENANDYFNKYLGYGSDCYFSKDYIPMEHCQIFEFQWSIGGKVTMFPDNVGVPIGESTDEYFMTEIHYDNPGLLSGVQVHAGMELYYTDNLREIDAGFLQLGVMTSKTYSLTIPPNSKNFVISSHCPSECMSNLPQEGVKAFIYLLHSHLAGRKQKIRHFREGQELPWLANDENYDFNYQNNRPLRKQVLLLPGDQLTLECTYDTSWKKSESQRYISTLGGRSARDEMCQAFLMYYPRVLSVNQCGSYVSQENMLQFMGIVRVEPTKRTNDPRVLSPEKFKGLKYSYFVENEVDWSAQKRLQYQHFVRFTPQKAYCAPFSTNDAFIDVEYPKLQNTFSEPNLCLLFTREELSEQYLFVLWIVAGITIITAVMVLTSMKLITIYQKRRVRNCILTDFNT